MTCISCGAEFELTFGDEHKREEFAAMGREWTPPKRCPRCRWERRQPVTVTCAECGASFDDERGHVEYVQRKGIPLKCWACRASR